MWNQKDFDQADVLFADIFHVYYSGGDVTNLGDFKAMLKDWFVGFPNLHHEVDDYIEQGEKIVTRWHGCGTHQGVFADIPATGKQFQYSGITIFYLDQDGKIKDAWVAMDLPDRLAELQS